MGTIRRLGTRYIYLRNFEVIKNAPYDYRKNGLLPVLIPTIYQKIENTITKKFLDYLDSLLIHLFDYISELKNFKNWTYHSCS